jgi:hypothetical protein
MLTVIPSLYAAIYVPLAETAVLKLQSVEDAKWWDEIHRRDWDRLENKWKRWSWWMRRPPPELRGNCCLWGAVWRTPGKPKRPWTLPNFSVQRLDICRRQVLGSHLEPFVCVSLYERPVIGCSMELLMSSAGYRHGLARPEFALFVILLIFKWIPSAFVFV